MTAANARLVVIAAIAGTTVGLLWAEHARRDARAAQAREIATRNERRNAARDLDNRKQFAAAEPIAREALDLSRRLHPGGDPDTASDLMALAATLAGARHYAEAAPLYHEAAEIRRALVSGDDLELARSINDEGVALMYLGRFVDAGQHFDIARAMRERLSPGDSADVAESLHNAAWSLEREHRPAEAETNYRRALEMYRRLFPGDPRSVNRELYALGWNVMEQGRWADAEDLLKRAVDMMTTQAPDSTEALIEQMSLVGTCELLRGQNAGAERWYARSLSMSQQSGGTAGASLPMLFVAGMVDDLDAIDSSRAVALSAAVYARTARLLPADSLEMFDGRVVYASALLASGTAADLTHAERLLREALSSAGPGADVRTAFAQSLLGGVILQQAEAGSPSSESARAVMLARLREAEPFVVSGFDALALLGDTIHPYYRAERLAGAAGRAARLFDLWNRLAPDAGLAAKAERYAHDAASYGGQSVPGT